LSWHTADCRDLVDRQALAAPNMQSYLAAADAAGQFHFRPTDQSVGIDPTLAGSLLIEGGFLLFVAGIVFLLWAPPSQAKRQRWLCYGGTLLGIMLWWIGA